MTIIQSIFLGLVQGVTEFLPVSSSGHLAILQNLLGIQTGSMLYSAMLHGGTLVALCIVFRKDLLRMLVEILRMLRDCKENLDILIHNKKDGDARRYKKIAHNNYRKLVLMILCSSIPTAIIGYAARDLVDLASQSLLIPGICLILTSGFLLVADVAESGKRMPKDITYTNAFLIGIAQGVSTLPGLSRSGITISSCLLSGFERRFAVKYSFLMSIPAIVGAIIVELQKGTAQTGAGQFLIYLLGTAAAGISGYYCIRRMLKIVRKKKFRGFALYCLLAGIFSIIGYLAMR